MHLLLTLDKGEEEAGARRLAAMDELFRDGGAEVTLKQLLELDDALGQLRRWQLLDFPTLQQLLDFLTRGDVGKEGVRFAAWPHYLLHLSCPAHTVPPYSC